MREVTVHTVISAPREQIFVRSRIGWMEDAADLPGDLERRPPPTS